MLSTHIFWDSPIFNHTNRCASLVCLKYEAPVFVLWLKGIHCMSEIIMQVSEVFCMAMTNIWRWILITESTLKDVMCGLQRMCKWENNSRYFSARFKSNCIWMSKIKWNRMQAMLQLLGCRQQRSLFLEEQQRFLPWSKFSYLMAKYVT